MILACLRADQQESMRNSGRFAVFLISPPYYEPRYGSEGAIVAQVQRRLSELGYYHGLVDGIMGPRPRAAISAYESRHGLIVNGMITPQLLDRMGIA